jgi:hypothetical protein
MVQASENTQTRLSSGAMYPGPDPGMSLDTGNPPVFFRQLPSPYCFAGFTCLQTDNLATVANTFSFISIRRADCPDSGSHLTNYFFINP